MNLSYSKEARRLSQSAVLDKLEFVVNSPYFGQYIIPHSASPETSSIDSTILKIESLGSLPSKTQLPLHMNQCAPFLREVFEAIRKDGTLHKVYLKLTPSYEALREKGFFPEVIGSSEEKRELKLPLFFIADREQVYDSHLYKLNVSNNGVYREKFSPKRLYPKTARLVSDWYEEIDEQLKPLGLQKSVY